MLAKDMYPNLEQARQVLLQDGYTRPSHGVNFWKKKDSKYFARILSFSKGYKIQYWTEET